MDGRDETEQIVSATMRGFLPGDNIVVQFTAPNSYENLRRKVKETFTGFRLGGRVIKLHDSQLIIAYQNGEEHPITILNDEGWTIIKRNKSIIPLWVSPGRLEGPASRNTRKRKLSRNEQSASTDHTEKPVDAPSATHSSSTGSTSHSRPPPRRTDQQASMSRSQKTTPASTTSDVFTSTSRQQQARVTTSSPQIPGLYLNFSTIGMQPPARSAISQPNIPSSLCTSRRHSAPALDFNFGSAAILQNAPHSQINPTDNFLLRPLGQDQGPDTDTPGSSSPDLNFVDGREILFAFQMSFYSQNRTFL